MMEANEVVELVKGSMQMLGIAIASFFAATYKMRRILKKDRLSDQVDDKTQKLIDFQTKMLTEMLLAEQAKVEKAEQTIQRLIKERDDAIHGYQQLESRVSELSIKMEQFDGENKELRGLIMTLTEEVAKITPSQPNDKPITA